MLRTLLRWRVLLAGSLLLTLACAGSNAPAPVPGPVPVPAPAPVEPAPAAPEPAAPVVPEPPRPAAGLNAPPEGWVDLAAHVPGLALDIRYHTAANFTEAPLPGYGAPGAWLRATPADALRKVQEALAAKGYSLKVFDAYRPLRGTQGMVAWAKRTNQVHLLDNGYVSRRSGHNRGNTIDLTAIELATGKELDMGTAWDTLSEASHTMNATGEALKNRLLLKDTMRAQGFVNYWKEWWHYVYVEEGEKELPHRDVPYGCFEAPEGQYEPPAGWDQPGFQMPTAVTPGPCVQ
jgi:D-alanyl-D-alanine dipeptidase